MTQKKMSNLSIKPSPVENWIFTTVGPTVRDICMVQLRGTKEQMVSHMLKMIEEDKSDKSDWYSDGTKDTDDLTWSGNSVCTGYNRFIDGNECYTIEYTAWKAGEFEPVEDD